MLKRLVLIYVLLLSAPILYAQTFDDAWKLLNNDENSKAEDLLEPKISNKSASMDEYLTYLMIEALSEKDERTDFLAFAKKLADPYPYMYALWFSDAVAGGYGYKTPSQLAVINYIMTAKVSNESLKASGHYGLGHYYTNVHQFFKSKKEYELVGGINEWQFVGPFNNYSGGGFNKNYEPISDTSSKSEFISADKAKIKWFTPKVASFEGWVYPTYAIPEKNSGIVFAQTFVNSPSDQDLLLCTGFSGNIKVWVNDQLIVSVPEEKVTELDTYNAKIHLNAGYNRILVQSGYYENSANFMIRLTDNNYVPLNLSVKPDPQPYKKNLSPRTIEYLPHFAETFFQEKIKSEPNNLLNYILLNRVYLRNKKILEARKIVEKAIEKAGQSNTVLKYELIQCYIKDNNRTGSSEIAEYFKEKEKNSLFGYILRIQDLQDNEKYSEALDLLEERINKFGLTAGAYDERIKLLVKKNEMPPLLAMVDEAYKKYPREATFANYVFNVEKNVNKNSKKAIKVLEKYLASNYNYNLADLLASEYFANGDKSKGYAIYKEMIDRWPFDPSSFKNKMDELVNEQRYPESLDVCNEMLELKPYSGIYNQNKAIIQTAMGKNDDAIASYEKALSFEPTLYDARKKQRLLQHKKPIDESAAAIDIDEMVKDAGKVKESNENDYRYLIYDRVTILYPQGGREEISTIGIKILNERGLDNFKESQLSYNESTEEMVVEDAQLIKANGKKTRPEINDAKIVWTGLESNDIIYIKYRKKFYLGGKRGQEFTDEFVFGGFVPFAKCRYQLIIPQNKKFTSKVVNGDVKPEKKDLEDYFIYTWEKNDIPPVKEEPYMPPTTDFTPTLHLSTMKDWNEVAQWYSEIVTTKLSNDYEVQDTYEKLFADKKSLTATEKASIIYSYISQNINYSSVSFRQSGIVPQKASKTINTRLGDCKDLSTLFVSLATLAGLKSNLVLVNTRDNGQRDLILPSFEFNHCIVRYYDEKNKDYYLELTDRDLPFKSLPSSLYQALSLTIPAKYDTLSKFDLIPIDTKMKTVNNTISENNITVKDNNLLVKSTTYNTGSLTPYLRSKYKALSDEKIKKDVQEVVAKRFSNPIKINSVNFSQLEKVSDTVSEKIDYEVTNEIKKIGGFFAFKIPYQDVVVSAETFSTEKRNYEFEYWKYESNDEYQTVTNITLPAGKLLEEVPKNATLNYKDFTYSLKYEKLGVDKLKVTRTVKTSRNNLSPEEYVAFKEFTDKIIEAEGTYVTFK